MGTQAEVLIELTAVAAAASLGLRTALAGVTIAHARRVVPALRRAPKISVLKPLCGLEPDLEANLRSMARQQYEGEYEILFGAADECDPAIVVARRIQREHPEVAIRVVSTSRHAASNPKVANLIGLTAHAQYDALLVSDSNVWVGAGYLRDMAAELQAGEGCLVANLVSGTDDSSLGAVLENLQLNGFTTAAACGAVLLAHPCVIGKSLLVPRAELERLGGWSAFGGLLGEDYALGRAFTQAGLRVCISSHVIAARSTGWTLRRFVERHLRWCQMRRWIAPGPYVLEPLLSPTPWCIATAAVAVANQTPSVAIVALLAVLWAIGLEAIAARVLRRAWPGLRYLGAVPLKEALMAALWLVAWFRREVSWRGTRFRLGPGSVLQPCLPPDAPMALGERPLATPEAR